MLKMAKLISFPKVKTRFVMRSCDFFLAKKYILVEPKEFFLDFELAALIGDLLLVLLFRLIFLLFKLLGKFWLLLLTIEVPFTAAAQWYINSMG